MWMLFDWVMGMKFPRWLKTLFWLALLLAVGYWLYNSKLADAYYKGKVEGVAEQFHRVEEATQISHKEDVKDVKKIDQAVDRLDAAAKRRELFGIPPKDSKGASYAPLPGRLGADYSFPKGLRYQRRIGGQAVTQQPQAGGVHVALPPCNNPHTEKLSNARGEPLYIWVSGKRVQREIEVCE
jgi:hypothetical protein